MRNEVCQCSLTGTRDYGSAHDQTSTDLRSNHLTCRVLLILRYGCHGRILRSNQRGTAQCEIF